MTKRYGDNGRWRCPECKCRFKVNIIRRLDIEKKLHWGPPYSSYREVGQYQDPKCPFCNEVMEYEA
jgi:tRNA(Ile2) C34 agmatinyltransferase TiaS